MIFVYAARFHAEYHDDHVDRYRHLLPTSLRNKFDSFRWSRDAQLFLLGKLLLLNGLDRFGYSNLQLDDLQYEINNKPYLLHGPKFNISHSGNYVLCALSDTHEVGIDIEQMNSIDIEELKSIWSEKEWDIIRASDNPIETFYKLWTRKEAVIKADGTGLTNNLKALDICTDTAVFNNNTWYLKRLQFEPGYEVHLATDKPAAKVIEISYLTEYDVVRNSSHCYG